LRVVEEVRHEPSPVQGNGKPSEPTRFVVIRHALDISTALNVKAELSHLLEAGHRRVVVEIEPRCEIDSSGLAVLVSVHRRMERLRGRLIVVNSDPFIASKLAILGLDRVLSLAGSRGEALAVL
jgi:anti-sigma B factor antagonist